MANLDHLRRELEAKVVKAARIVARDVERELKVEAPVETGLLQSMIEAQVRVTVIGARIDITSGAPYAQYVEEHTAEWGATMKRLPDMIQRAWRATR